MTLTSTTPALARRTGPTALATAAGAVAAPLLIWLLADPIGGLDLQVRQGEDLFTVGPVAVVIAAMVASAVALGLARALGRARHGRAVFVTVASIGLLVSLAGPLGAATDSTGLVLASMHLAVGAVLITGGRRRIHPGTTGSRHDG